MALVLSVLVAVAPVRVSVVRVLPLFAGAVAVVADTAMWLTA